MAGWKKECKEFIKVRELINDGDDCKGILSLLSKICSEYAHQKWYFADEYASLYEDINDVIDGNEYDEFDVDAILSEFYDLCDSAGVWLSF